MNDRARSVILTAFTMMMVATATGCSARMAVVAHEKQAYMVKESSLGFNSDMYFCDATAGKPVCRKITEGE
jgi:hypothetical protein